MGRSFLLRMFLRSTKGSTTGQPGKLDVFFKDVFGIKGIVHDCTNLMEEIKGFSTYLRLVRVR